MGKCKIILLIILIIILFIVKYHYIDKKESFKSYDNSTQNYRQLMPDYKVIEIDKLTKSEKKKINNQEKEKLKEQLKKELRQEISDKINEHYSEINGTDNISSNTITSKDNENNIINNITSNNTDEESTNLSNKEKQHGYYKIFHDLEEIKQDNYNSINMPVGNYNTHKEDLTMGYLQNKNYSKPFENNYILDYITSSIEDDKIKGSNISKYINDTSIKESGQNRIMNKMINRNINPNAINE